MCGRYKRPGKQKIAEAFALSEGLETTFDLEPDDNACSQSFLPVIHLNENGDRQIELMRWACDGSGASSTFACSTVFQSSDAFLGHL